MRKLERIIDVLAVRLGNILDAGERVALAICLFNSLGLKEDE